MVTEHTGGGESPPVPSFTATATIDILDDALYEPDGDEGFFLKVTVLGTSDFAFDGTKLDAAGSSVITRAIKIGEICAPGRVSRPPSARSESIPRPSPPHRAPR